MEYTNSQIKALIDEGYETAKQILTENRAKLDFVADFLLKNEMMDSDQFEAAMSRDGVTFEELEAITAEKRERSRMENEERARRTREDAEAAARSFAAEHGFTDADFSGADFTDNESKDENADNTPKD